MCLINSILHAGVRQGRGIGDHLFVNDDCGEVNQPGFTCCVDYTKAFDSVQICG